MEKTQLGIHVDLSKIDFPCLAGRYIVIDTETTGPHPVEDNIIEIACIEIENGKITGNEFHAFLHPRHEINPMTEKKHKLSNNFYEQYFSDVYISDKKCLEMFKLFVGGSIIFTHNAITDCQFINNELQYWNLPKYPKERFVCTMQIFRSIFPHLSRNYVSLSKCCEYFNLVSPNQNFHSAIHDSFMTARMVCKFFEIFNNKENYIAQPEEKEINLLTKKTKRDTEEEEEEKVNDEPIVDINKPDNENIVKNNNYDDDPIILGLNDINIIINEF